MRNDLQRNEEVDPLQGTALGLDRLHELHLDDEDDLMRVQLRPPDGPLPEMDLRLPLLLRGDLCDEIAREADLGLPPDPLHLRDTDELPLRSENLDLIRQREEG